MLDALGDTGSAPVPEHDDAPPPLGRLLIDRGLLTEGQLQVALAEQGRTGLPIGQVLISLSYVTAATIAQALATQDGGVVRTEFGLSTGFGTPGLVSLPPVSPPQAASAPASIDANVIQLPEPQPEPVAEPELEPEPAAQEPVREPAPLAVVALEPVPMPAPEPAPQPEPVATVELPTLPSTTARIAELLAQEIASATSASNEELSAARGRIAELEHETFELRRQVEAARATDDLLAAANARIAELEQEAANAASAASASADELSAVRTRVAELDHELFGLRQRAEAADAAEGMLGAARAHVAELEAELPGLRRRAEAADAAEAEVETARNVAADRIQALEIERDARVTELQQMHAQLVSTTENLRSAYERLHQFEIAQALQQHEQARTSSQYTWQS